MKFLRGVVVVALVRKLWMKFLRVIRGVVALVRKLWMKFLRVVQGVVALIKKLWMKFLRVIRGVVAIGAPFDVCTAVMHEPGGLRSQCRDFLVSCFLTAVLYFFTYIFFCIPLIVQFNSSED
jgi:hypothetical protein